MNLCGEAMSFGGTVEREEFAQLKNFGLREKDSYGRLITARLRHIEPDLMAKADYMVGIAKKYFDPYAYFIVHDINLGEHSEDSFHYSGEAIDGHFKKLTLAQMFYCAQLAGFKGIGAYGCDAWDNPGIHADVREQVHQLVWYGWEDEVWDAKLQETVPTLVYEYNRKDVFEYINDAC